MRETTKESPVDRGEVELPGRCQVCGAEGKTIAVPSAPPPNEFCARCAIEYGEAAAADEADEDEP
ncbi:MULTISPECIES: hypothetical protein [unclassified Anaeromyxobacter]|uniref:hypothetical protein n=1 Tax=unclassified Anaeromyxobacter TaxID=2620896 RepID=UPI001F56498C|nr:MULTISPECIES: hypothetical protein [unclassified Anaeromyxobacter]